MCDTICFAIQPQLYQVHSDPEVALKSRYLMEVASETDI